MNEADVRSGPFEPIDEQTDSSLRNSVTVESPYGLRCFALRFGDVTKSPDSVLVVPTHAYERYAPDGHVLSAAQASFDLDFENTELLVSGRTNMIGTYRLRDKGSYRGNEVLLVRIPGQGTGVRNSQDPLESLSEALWTLFGSLAALELRTTALTSLAMPLLAGTRGYEIRDLLKVILHHALAWLRVSRYMSAVNFYLVNPKAIKEWNSAMDEVLGRHSVDSTKNASVSLLRNEILARLNDGASAMLPIEWSEVVTELRNSLQSKHIPIERVAVAARRLTELIVRWLLVDLGDSAKGNLGPQLESLKSKKIVAPWIIAHLECLKHFGNAAAHSNQTVSYDPPSLRSDDLLGLLASLQRVLEFSINRSTR